MSLSLIDKLHQQAKNASQNDVSQICSNLLDIFHVSEKSAECMALLRQLFFILQATESQPSLPKQLIVDMLNTVATAEKSKPKECLICQRVLQELLPLDEDVEEDVKKFEEKIPSTFHLQLLQDKDIGCFSKLFANAVRWLQSQDVEFDVHRRTFSFLTGLSILHGDVLVPGKVKAVNERLGSWLMDVGLYQAPNPYTSNPFRKDQKNLVTEVDGTSSTNFFTVLNIGQYYTDEQWMNIYSFSMLYQWIYHSYSALAEQKPGPRDDEVQKRGPRDEEEVQKRGPRDEGEAESEEEATPTARSRPISQPIRSVTPTKQKLTGSLSSDLSRSSPSSSLTSSLPPMRGSVHRTLSGGKPRTITPLNMSRPATPVDEQRSSLLSESGDEVLRWVFDSLVGRTLDYCFRILDQCDRMAECPPDSTDNEPKVPSDADLQKACLLETVKLLDLICKIDSSQVPKAFRELKRLSTETSLDETNPALLIVIIQFLINHCDAVAYDPHEELNTMFHRMLSRNFNVHSISFDIVLFILDNLAALCHDFSITATYFPNIFKLLAWNPRTYIEEFISILPALMSEVTSLEVFHTLLDLPCMTISLEVMEKMKNVDFSNLPVNTDDTPTSSVEAFKNAMFRPMFNFFTRAEGGHGDTINRLAMFHAALQDMLEYPRVLVCYQVVPVLIRTWFNEILAEASLELVRELIPVILERSTLLYGIREYQLDINKIISQHIRFLIKKYPSVILAQKTDINEFLSNTRNIAGREDFFCEMIYSVGEYSSTRYDPGCSADIICQMYEVLEVLMYEVVVVTAKTPRSEAPYTVMVVTCLMSALAKLASRCHDLIPRAILCLTKVAKQHQNEPVDETDQYIVLHRAQELVNLLKRPNMAAMVLSPTIDYEIHPVHREPGSMATLLQATYRIMQPKGE